MLRAAQGAVDSMGGLLVQGLEEAFRKDVAGNADGTPERVGRFNAFVQAVVSLASETIAGKIDSLKRDVEDCVKSTLRKVACPSYNLKARQGRIEMDPKVLVDAVMHIVLDVALAPLVDDSVVENAAKACATWEESCAETRSSLEKELKSVEKVMEIEIFKGGEELLRKKKAADEAAAKKKAADEAAAKKKAADEAAAKKKAADEAAAKKKAADEAAAKKKAAEEKAAAKKKALEDAPNLVQKYQNEFSQGTPL
eukprot:g10640.t1